LGVRGSSSEQGREARATATPVATGKAHRPQKDLRRRGDTRTTPRRSRNVQGPPLRSTRMTWSQHRTSWRRCAWLLPRDAERVSLSRPTARRPTTQFPSSRPPPPGCNPRTAARSPAATSRRTGAAPLLRSSKGSSRSSSGTRGRSRSEASRLAPRLDWHSRSIRRSRDHAPIPMRLRVPLRAVDWRGTTSLARRRDARKRGRARRAMPRRCASHQQWP
jgi:hypothetical protein